MRETKTNITKKISKRSKTLRKPKKKLIKKSKNMKDKNMLKKKSQIQIIKN